MSTVTGSVPVVSAPPRIAGPRSAPTVRPTQVDSGSRVDPGVQPASAGRRDPLRVAARLSPLLGLALSIGLVTWGLQTGVLGSLESLRTFIDSLGVWGPAAFLVVCAALVVFPVIPGGLPVLAAPVLFGPVEGVLYSYVAVCAGLMLNFTIGRHVGLGLIERLVAPRALEKFLGWTRHRRFTRAFAVAIALPIAPDDLLCYIAGTTRMQWRDYILIILLGKPWSLLLYGLGVSTVVLRFLPW